jgi:type II secretory pathway component PulM
MKSIQLPKIDFSRIADDFRNADPKDVGNWAPAPKIAVLAGLLVASVAAGWWFLWDPLMVELEQKRAQGNNAQGTVAAEEGGSGQSRAVSAAAQRHRPLVRCPAQAIAEQGRDGIASGRYQPGRS